MKLTRDYKELSARDGSTIRLWGAAREDRATKTRSYLIQRGRRSVTENPISLVGTSGFAVLDTYWKAALLDKESHGTHCKVVSSRRTSLP